MIILLFTLVQLITTIPIEYKGWINNCTFYFNSTLPPQPQSSFIECHTHLCEKQYMLNCDEYTVIKNYTLDQCMPLCCSDKSQYTPFNSVLQFLSQCEQDYIARRNRQIVDLNRLPFIILGWTFLGMFLMIGICLAFAYWEEIMLWARQRLGNANRNDAGIQMRNLLN